MDKRHSRACHFDSLKIKSSKLICRGGSSPSVVLGVEQEVGAHDGDADSDDAQDHQHQHHEAVDVVDLVGPERCEDKIPRGRK